MLFLFKSFYIIFSLCIYNVIGNELERTRDSIEIPCAVRKDISPCTCMTHATTQGMQRPWIIVTCQKMNSFSQIINVLQNKFEKNVEIHLMIEYSNLEDMSKNKFSDIRSPISWIMLYNNTMTELPNSSFEGISTVTHLQLHDSKINQFPGTIFEHLPNVQYLSIERTSIKTVSPSNFKSLRKLKNLVIRECNLTIIENATFPQTLTNVFLPYNNISTLNHTLRDNFNLKVVVLANNDLESLNDQIPDYKPNSDLVYLDISSNRLTGLPKSFQNLKCLDSFYASRNRITGLNNVLNSLRRLIDVDLGHNQISELSETEFEGCVHMNRLNLSNNEIWSLNKSLIPMASLEFLNLTHNKLTEFSLDEIQGLTRLDTVELTYNKIVKFIGKTKKEPSTFGISIKELRLEFNELQILEGTISEVVGLIHLNMSYNKLESIPAEFLSGLKELQILDVSHNLLHTLQDTSKALLPSLGYFFAAYNKIDELNGIFSAVCFMHLEYNEIKKIGSEIFADNNPCVYKPGANATLYVYLEGNDILCKDVKKITEVESRNNTKIVGQCQRLSNDLIKYNVTNTDSSPITVITLDE